MFCILIQLVGVIKLMKKNNSILINTANFSTRNGIFNTKLSLQVKKTK